MASNGWYGLLAILKERQDIKRQQSSVPPLACPNDGEPLQTTRSGKLICLFDGWEYPRDEATAIR